MPPPTTSWTSASAPPPARSCWNWPTTPSSSEPAAGSAAARPSRPAAWPSPPANPTPSWPKRPPARTPAARSCEWPSWRAPSGAGQQGFGFDLDLPAGVEEGGDGQHRGSGADRAEDLAVDGADGPGVGGVDEEGAGADDVGGGRAGLGQGGEDDLQAAAGLDGGVGVARPVRPDRCRPGDEDVPADPQGPGKADGGLERRPGGDPLTPGVRGCPPHILLHSLDARAAHQGP